MESMEGYDMSFEGRDNLFKELWKACAGSIVDLPEAGDRVMYFPQGHLEQLEESTSLELDNISSVVHLPSKIYCRICNFQLRVGDDDEVFAQITLIPEAEHENTLLREKITGDHLQLTDYPVSCPPHIPEPKFYSFSKVLSASDINAHCRLHVLKQHAEKCLPPMDMTQQTPSQELKARDLHGTRWTFKHVFGGQPRRHLFTTGWSNFVNSKGLVAGDTFVCVRGENGELGVGIRRLARRYISKPSRRVPSESMAGVLATVSQAITTGTMFTVFYRPRKSEFIIGLNKYLEAVNHGFSVGMRFSMQFKGEDLIQRKYWTIHYLVIWPIGYGLLTFFFFWGPLPLLWDLVRYTGIIIGFDDIDPRWQNSAWRSLKVQWEESTSITRSNRVSCWEIEPLVASIPSRLVPPLGSKKKGKIPRSQVVKRRKTKPELQEKHLGTMTKELSQPTVPSSDCAVERYADMLLVPVLGTCDFDKDSGLQEQNNEGYYCEDDPTTRDGSEHMRNHPLVPWSARSANDITQPNFHAQSNQVLIGGEVGGPSVSEIAYSIPNTSPGSDRSDSWLTGLLRDIPEQSESQSEASPFREQHLPKDPCMPLQQTSSTELPCSPKVIAFRSQIPFTGSGNGNELISWQAYRVARRCVPILDRVISRYPATLSGFRAMSDACRLMFLEILAEVVYMLEQLKVENIDMEHLDIARSYLKDLKMSGIDMSWLEGRLDHIDGVWKKNRLVQRGAELAMEVADASAKARRLEEELSSLDMELAELASRIDADPLSTDQSVIQGLL